MAGQSKMLTGQEMFTGQDEDTMLTGQFKMLTGQENCLTGQSKMLTGQENCLTGNICGRLGTSG